MGCFSLGFLQQLLIWLVIAAAIIAIIRLLIPWLTSITFPIVGQVLEIVLWAVIAIIAIYIIFALIGCLLGMAGPLRLPGR
jgi:hypothetical protein